MELIEKILDLGDKHSRVVIIVLLGFLAAGTVGGSLWIHSLQVVIDNEARMNEQRLSVLKDERDLEESRIRGNVDMFTADFKTETLIIHRTADEIAQLSKSPKLPISAKADLARIHDELLNSLDKVSVDYELAQVGAARPVIEYRRPLNLLLPVLIIFMLVACLVVMFVWVKRRKRLFSRNPGD